MAVTHTRGDRPCTITASTRISTRCHERLERAPQIVAATNALLAMLDSSSTSTLVLDYPTTTTPATADDFSGRVGEQFGTSVWLNHPISDVIRQGIRLGDMSEEQRSAAMAVLAAALSDDG